MAVVHLADSKKQLFSQPDVVHAFKNVKGTLCKGKKITLPDSVVEKKELASPIATVSRIHSLIKTHEHHNLKIACKLNENCLHQVI